MVKILLSGVFRKIDSGGGGFSKKKSKVLLNFFLGRPI